MTTYFSFPPSILHVVDNVVNANAMLATENKMKDALTSLNILASDGFPFSYFETEMKSNLSKVSSSDNVSISIETQQKMQLDYTIRNIQKNISDIDITTFDEDSDKNQMNPYLQVLSPDTIISIPSKQHYQFGVIFRPKATNDSNEWNVNACIRSIQVKLLPDDDDTLENIKLLQELKSRSLIIRAKVCRSEMTLLQHNINFGKIIIGESSTKSVTIANRSNTPLFYGISKSGSISSGFLLIPSGRRGQILPKSSLVIDFILKPTLPGNFEELIQIYNILDPHNAQSLVVKAKVSKPEVFRVIFPSAESFLSSPETPGNNTNISLLNSNMNTSSSESGISTLDNSSNNDASSANIINSSVSVRKVDTPPLKRDESNNVETGGNNNTKTVEVNDIGTGAVGVQCVTKLTFNIQNVSARRRQLIIDANHLDAVMLDHNTLVRLKNDTDVNVNVSDMEFDTAQRSLESIVNARFRFEVSKYSQYNGNKLSADERQGYLDKLEKFHQKLKIAHRKSKLDKIAKYQKKIKQVQDLLMGIVSTIDDDEEDVKEEDDNNNKQGSSNSKNTATITSSEDGTLSLPPQPISSNAEIVSTVTTTTTNNNNNNVISDINNAVKDSSYNVVVNSDVSLHLECDPDCELTLSIWITFIPGSSYRPWKEILPFKGYLRVFEAKNEDSVKFVPYSVYLFSSEKSLVANMKRSNTNMFPTAQSLSDEIVSFTNQLQENDSTTTAFTRTESVDTSNNRYVDNKTPVELSTTMDEPTNSLLFASSRTLPMTVTKFRPASEVFITTVTQWSSYPTKLIFPDYRLQTQNILGMAVKLVQVNKEGLTQGMLSIASLSSRDTQVSIHILDNWSLTQDAKVIMSNIENIKDVTESPNITTTATSYNSDLYGKINMTAECSSDNESEVMQQYGNSISSVLLRSNGKLDCLLEWKLDTMKQQNRMDKVMLGCICIEVMVGSDTVSMQYVPFVSFLERKSSFKFVDKYVNFGEIYTGTTKLATASILNNSDEDFHYFTSLKSPVNTYQPAIGRAVLKNGHTGVIPPHSTKQVILQLIAYENPGRFEQDLWILNLTDRADQKKLSLTANVIIDTTAFISFPDLSLKDSENTKSCVYNTIDFGYIQIPIHSSREHSGQIKHASILYQRNNSNSSINIMKKYNYVLRVENIATVNLYLCASSNLKNQCFLYVDEMCTIPVLYYHLLPKSISHIYVVIKPSLSRLATSNYGTNTPELLYLPPKSSSQQQLALSGNISTLLSSTSATTTSASAAATATAAAATSISTSTSYTKDITKGQDLVGGIHLSFFNETQYSYHCRKNENENASTSPNINSNVLKLDNPETLTLVKQDSFFDITLDFQAKVGQSMMLLKPLNNKMIYINQVRQTPAHSFDEHVFHTMEINTSGSLKRLRYDGVSISQTYALVELTFGLENKSQTFPLQYIIRNDDDCMQILQNLDIHKMSRDEKILCALENNYIKSIIESGKVVIVVFIDKYHDESRKTHSLQPNEDVIVTYGLLYNVLKVSGLMKYTITVANICTGDIQSFNASAFVDPSIISCDYSSCNNNNNNMTTSPNNVGAQNNTSKYLGDIMNDAMILIQPKAQSNDNNINETSVMRMNSPNIPSLTTSNINNNNCASPYIGESLGNNSNSNSNNMNNNNNNSIGMYEVIGSTERVLCSWTFQNLSSGTVTVTPVSDLPIIVTISAVTSVLDHEMRNQEQHFKSIHSTVRREDKSHRSLLSLTSGHWKGGMYKCGDSVTIQALAHAKVTVTVQHNNTLSEQFIMDQLLNNKKQSIAMLNDGNSCQGKGIVALVHSNQALHSFYQPAAYVPTTTKYLLKEKDISNRSNLLSLFTPSTFSNSNSNSDSISDNNSINNVFSFTTHQNINSNLNTTSHSSQSSMPSSVQLYDVVSLTRISLNFVVPKIKIPSTTVKLGVLRCGQQLEFSADIENISEVEIPITIESLPSWIRLHHSMDALTPSRSSVTFPDNSLDRRLSRNSGMNNINDDPSNSNTVFSVRRNSLSEHKLKLWLANKSLIHKVEVSVNADIYSNASSHLSMDDEMHSSDEDGEDDDNNDESDSENGVNNNTNNNHINKNNSSDNNENDDSDNISNRADYEGFYAGNDVPLVSDEFDKLNTKVTHLAMFIDSPMVAKRELRGVASKPSIEDIFELRKLIKMNMQNINRTSSDDSAHSNSDTSDKMNSKKNSGNNSVSSSTPFPKENVLPTTNNNSNNNAMNNHKLNTFVTSASAFTIFIAPKSIFPVKFLATAPRVESQILEHTFHVRNLASFIIGNVPEITGEQFII